MTGFLGVVELVLERSGCVSAAASTTGPQNTLILLLVVWSSKVHLGPENEGESELYWTSALAVPRKFSTAPVLLS